MCIFLLSVSYILRGFCLGFRRVPPLVLYFNWEETTTFVSTNKVLIPLTHNRYQFDTVTIDYVCCLLRRPFADSNPHIPLILGHIAWFSLWRIHFSNRSARDIDKFLRFQPDIRVTRDWPGTFFSCYLHIYTYLYVLFWKKPIVKMIIEDLPFCAHTRKASVDLTT